MGQKGVGFHAYKLVTTTLSPREREVLELVKEGYRNRKIAEQLHISIETAKTYIQYIKIKLGVDQMYSSRMLIVIKALRQGIISLDKISLEDRR